MQTAISRAKNALAALRQLAPSGSFEEVSERFRLQYKQMLLAYGEALAELRQAIKSDKLFGQAIEEHGLDQGKPFDDKFERAAIQKIVSALGNLPNVEADSLIAACPNTTPTNMLQWLRRQLAPLRPVPELDSKSAPEDEPSSDELSSLLHELMNVIGERYAQDPTLPALHNPHNNLMGPKLLNIGGINYEDSCDIVVNAEAEHGQVIGYARGVKVTLLIEPMRIAVVRIGDGASPFELDNAPEDGSQPPQLIRYLQASDDR